MYKRKKKQFGKRNKSKFGQKIKLERKEKLEKRKNIWKEFIKKNSGRKDRFLEMS